MTGFDMGGRLPIFGRVGEMTTGGIVMAVILLVIAAAAVIFAVRARMNGARRLELTMKATVAEKRETGDVCRVTFALPEGEEVTLKLSITEAALLREGQAGELTMRGKEFISFR